MNTIYNLDSDSSLLDELSYGIRNRQIDQKFMYLLDGAELYYKEKKSNDIYNLESLEKKDFLDFLKKNNFLNTDKSALISLGCGNSMTEKYLYENSVIDNVDYFGVDSSNGMLKLSINNFKDISINKSFICADFSTKNFRSELQQLTKSHNNKVFVFFSNTFGNITHTNIIDILGNLLDKGEKIWLDIRIRKGKTVQHDFNISNTFAKDLERDDFENILLKVLKGFGVKSESGILTMKTTKDDTIGALKFNFGYLFKKKTKINIKGDEIIILPGEKITVQQIYAYDPESLITFFDQHGFNFLDKQIKGYRGQFLFEKK